MGNLITVAGQVTIEVHAGVSATITSTFAAPESYARGISMDMCGKVYVHSGISSTIASSFAQAAWSNGATMDAQGGC